MLARPTRSTTALLLLLAGVSAPGCKNAEQECAQAQDRAARAWEAYIAVLEPAYGRAVETQRDTAAALAVDMEKRVSDIARAKADALYDRNDGAWQRAYQAAYEAACREDEQCAKARIGNAQSRKDGEELREKLQAAREARDAARGPAAKARLAADKVPNDYANRELVKAARAASEAASLACREVKP